MKVISKKQSICTSIKVYYQKDEDYYQDIKQKKKEGWHPITRHDSYHNRPEVIIKHSSNGVVITYIRYDNI